MTSSPARRWAPRVLITLAVSTTFVWIGAIVYGAVADYHLTGWLEDRTFPEAAEPICKAAVADLREYPLAYQSTSPLQRAAVIRATTARLQTMLDDLDDEVPRGPDAEWINLWLADWSLHLDDRLDFATRLEERGATEEFFESTKANTQISKSLDHYAEVNQMESCSTPGDV